MIESSSDAWLALQKREPDDAVAQVTALFVINSILVGHARGNFFHAEKGFVELRHAKMIFRVNSDVPDFCGHVSLPPRWLDSFQRSRPVSTPSRRELVCFGRKQNLHRF